MGVTAILQESSWWVSARYTQNARAASSLEKTREGESQEALPLRAVSPGGQAAVLGERAGTGQGKELERTRLGVGRGEPDQNGSGVKGESVNVGRSGDDDLSEVSCILPVCQGLRMGCLSGTSCWE